jgi:hypothetical protein
VAAGLEGVSLVAADLVCLLSHKGFKHFMGFSISGDLWHPPSAWSFWRWFGQTQPWHVPGVSPHFWHEDRP